MTGKALGSKIGVLSKNPIGAAPHSVRRVVWGLVAFLGTVLAVGCQPGNRANTGADILTGDWDYYRMLGGETRGGFEAKRRFGFAHFDGLDPAAAWLHRRAGGDLEAIQDLRLEGDSLFLDFSSGRSVQARINGDTVSGRIFQEGDAIQRMWFVRRNAPPVYEPYYPLWAGPISDSTYSVEIDPAVPMQARDGTTLMSFVGRPVGGGPLRDSHGEDAVPSHRHGQRCLLGVPWVHLR